jgi:site-specific DNA-methyltransferase (adenine-specific)
VTGKVYHRADRQDWATPAWLFRELDLEFRFTLDVAASPANAKCRHFYTADDDALLQPWAPQVCWCNPPYGRSIGSWMAKARDEAKRGAVVVMLLPSRTDTAWWHEHVERKAFDVRFLRGRLNFDGGKRSQAPFPSVIVIYRSLHRRCRP